MKGINRLKKLTAVCSAITLPVGFVTAVPARADLSYELQMLRSELQQLRTDMEFNSQMGSYIYGGDDDTGDRTPRIIIVPPPVPRTAPAFAPCLPPNEPMPNGGCYVPAPNAKPVTFGR